jgi:phosphotransferase family enzyme
VNDSSSGPRTAVRDHLSLSKFPSSERLSAGLNAVFRNNGSNGGGVTVLRRQPNRFESTFASEIVTCRLGANGKIRVFCKYGTSNFDRAFGHRGGVSYEAAVYSKVLAPLHTSTPRFHGVYKEKRSNQTWLMIEYLKEASRDVSKTNDAVVHAARWIGRFHAVNEKRISSKQLAFLRTYDTDYYAGWARRAKRLFGRRRTERLWLPDVCAKFEQLIPYLLRARRTVIHGEYYPTNIIYQNGVSRPADWQSAAIAVGQIDLAALTQNWPRRMVNRLTGEYIKARWPTGAPEHFDRLFGIARVYMTLRWLGDPGLASPSVRRGILARRTEHLSIRSQNLVRKYRRFIEELRSEGESLGLT